MNVSWDDKWFRFLAGQIRLADADTRLGGLTGLERYQAISELRRYVEGDTGMAKAGPKGGGPKGAVPSKTGAKHDANVIKVSNRWGKTGVESTGKHAKPPKGGGGKK